MTSQGPLQRIPSIRLDHSLLAIFNDLTCTTADKRPNQDWTPQEIQYVGGKGNFGVWKINGSSEYWRKIGEVSAQNKAVVAMPASLPASIEELTGVMRGFLTRASQRAGVEPTLQAILAKLQSVDLTNHPIFFDAVRDNYIDIFTVGQGGFKSWSSTFGEEPIPGLVYNIDHEALLQLKEYLDNQPAESEVHTINWLYSAAVCAYYLEELVQTLDEEAAVPVLQPGVPNAEEPEAVIPDNEPDTQQPEPDAPTTPTDPENPGETAEESTTPPENADNTIENPEAPPATNE